MPIQLNSKEHNAIQKRKVKHIAKSKDEIERIRKGRTKVDVGSILTPQFFAEQGLSAAGFMGAMYILETIAAYVVAASGAVTVAAAVTSIGWALLIAVSTVIGVVGVVFILKEYKNIKKMEDQFKAGKLKDDKGKVIKTRKKFIEAVAFSLSGVHDPKVRRLIDRLIGL